MANPSELLFEKYLVRHGHTDWEYEPDVERKRPDYRLKYQGSHLYFEVKEFDAPKLAPGLNWFDPYKPIRKKIARAAEQFKGCKDFSCSLVLANLSGAVVRLGKPEVVMAAMLGDLAFQVPLGLPPGSDRDRTVFTRGGKMVDDRGMPQNTTVSSLIVLGTYSPHEKRIEAAARRRAQALGRKMTIDEAVEAAVGLVEEMGDDTHERKVRVVVFENPFARVRLSRELFRGPFDERWNVGSGTLRRAFVGDGVARCEGSLNQNDTC